MFTRDPLARPELLIRRVYAYAAYRLGDGPDAEDATSETFERALRYRTTYDPRKGEPLAWLIGIARRCVDEARVRPPATATALDAAAPGDLEEDVVRRLTVQAAVGRLAQRDRELLALRFGADLTAQDERGVEAPSVDLERGAVHPVHLGDLVPIGAVKTIEISAPDPERPFGFAATE